MTFALKSFCVPAKTIPLKIERNSQVMDVTLTPATRQLGRDKIGEAGMEAATPIKHVTVTSVETGKPGDLAGMKAGDKITAVNGQPLKSWSEFKNALQVSNGQPIAVTVERDAKPMDLSASPVLIDGEYKLAIGISIMPLATLVKTSSATEALRYGWDYNWRILRGTAIGFPSDVCSGSRSVRDSVQGPVGMATATMETYNAGGWASMIPWMGFLSLNLGIFNLLPIPVLDGGMIVMLFVEGLMGLVGWTMTMKLRERIQTVGLAIVGALIIFVFGNDFLRLGENYFSKKAAQPAQVQEQAQPKQQAPAQTEQSPQPASK
jgi:regulator of sigma E protease